eukprot:scaffold3408_cov129-Amphora_coffeaeformis.AAC.3
MNDEQPKIQQQHRQPTVGVWRYSLRLDRRRRPESVGGSSVCRPSAPGAHPTPTPGCVPKP